MPKTELPDEVWGDRFVPESSLTSRIKWARRAIGDTGRDQRVIKTIHSRGYRFVADVVDVVDAADNPDADVAVAAAAVRAGDADAAPGVVRRDGAGAGPTARTGPS